MIRKIFFLTLFAIFSIKVLSAREVYCSIVKEKDNTYQIIPNEEYLTETYWNFITKDRAGKIKQFKELQDAINTLSNFGWYVVKGQETNSDLVIMGHIVESFFEIKSSREGVFDLENY